MIIDLKDIARQALYVARERERLGQLKSDTFSILKHCAGEVCEATDAYTRLTESDNEIFDETLKEHFAEELADIITCALIAAEQEGVDIKEALFHVQAKNFRRIKDDKTRT